MTGINRIAKNNDVLRLLVTKAWGEEKGELSKQDCGYSLGSLVNHIIKDL